MSNLDIPDLNHEAIRLLRAPAPQSAEPKRRESEAQFRELMAHLEQVFWMKNSDDTAVLYISPAYEKIWARTRSSLYDDSHSFLDSIHPEDRERVSRAMSRKRETEGYEEEYRILRPDGTMRWIWARAYPVRNEAGEIKRYAGIAEDVSERKWAEKERSRLAAIIEHSEDAIVSITLDGIIIAWNHGAERKYGYSAAEIIGHSILALVPPDHAQAYMEVMKKVRSGVPVASYDTVRRRKDGTLINFSVGISPIEARDGEIVGVSKVGHDISRVRTLEAQLIEAQKMEVIGQLTGGVAHDFNNLLTVIQGYSELMMQELAPDNPKREQIAAIWNAAKRGSGLTRQLLLFSRNEAVQPVVLDLNEVLGGAESILRQLMDRNIELTLNRGTGVGLIKADPGYIGQLLMNMVVNARDAMSGGGKLVIATSGVTLDEKNSADHSGASFGDYVMLQISDTGAGMSDEIKAHLFEPFFTTKPRGKGTGLGLTTCQTIVRQSGGHIGITSEMGKGTTFKIYFPRSTEAPDSAPPSLLPCPLPRGTEILLVIEDDPEVRHMVCRVLRAQGYETLAAVNGRDGLRVMSEHKGSPIRLVICDVIMPRMSGKAMAGLLETGNSGVKMLFTSGYADEAILPGGALDPDIAFLRKPYAIATLIHKVRELLDVSPTALV